MARVLSIAPLTAVTFCVYEVRDCEVGLWGRVRVRCHIFHMQDVVTWYTFDLNSVLENNGSLCRSLSCLFITEFQNMHSVIILADYFNVFCSGTT